MKTITITDPRKVYPTTTITVADDVRTYAVVQEYVVANGGHPFDIEPAGRHCYGRFLVQERKESNE